MTKGEAKMLETDVNIYPLQFAQENKEINSTKQTTNEIIIEETSSKINVRARFARLKKSMRKRSVSIL